MAITVALEPKGKRNLERLEGLLKSIDDLSWVLEQTGQAVVSHIDLGFRNSTDPYGDKWAPLSPVTIKRRRGSSSQILKDTGALANSFNYDILRGQNVLVVGSTDIKSTTHQFGARKGSYGKGVPWGDMPARKLIPDESGLPVEIEDEIAEITQEFLIRNLR